MRKRITAFKHAFSGLTIFFSETFHARVHLIAALAVMCLGLYFSISSQEWIAIVLCIALVFSLEAVNSAIEYTVDLACMEENELAKKAKDVSAGAVLVSALFSCIIAAIIFIPYLRFLW